MTFLTGANIAGNIVYLDKMYGGIVSNSFVLKDSIDLHKLFELGDAITVNRCFPHKNSIKIQVPNFHLSKAPINKFKPLATRISRRANTWALCIGCSLR